MPHTAHIAAVKVGVTFIPPVVSFFAQFCSSLWNVSVSSARLTARKLRAVRATPIKRPLPFSCFVSMGAILGYNYREFSTEKSLPNNMRTWTKKTTIAF
jgi:hypothetical protein